MEKEKNKNFKICSICGKERFLWKSHPPTCKFCIKSKPINKISSKRKKTLLEYKPKRKEFLKENSLCQLKLQGCTYYATCIHHLQGKKSEELYLDSTKWYASCINCNNIVETLTDPYTQGLKIKQNSK